MPRLKNIFDLFRRRGVWIAEILFFLLVLTVLLTLIQQGIPECTGWYLGDFRIPLWLVSAAFFVVSVPALFLLWQAVLVCFYRPVTAWNSPQPLPSCTVIVPAYNEGRHVADTLRSLLLSDYPAEKLEIIAVNDGSGDDTLEWIQQAARESGGRIKVVDLKRNGGKKRALYRGFQEASGELVLTVDSDSLVEKGTVSNLILPFADAKVGGVAGTVRVGNLADGIVPRMLDVCFVFSCDFMRCAQSVIGSVLCSPGAVSAYRRAVLMPHLDQWVEQRFLGVPADIGEDRALTSILLRNDYRVVLQHEARVTTNVPVDYAGLCRTLIRWTRGDVREGLVMSRHFFFHSRLFSWRSLALRFNLLCQLIGLALPVICLPLTLLMVAVNFRHVLFICYYGILVSWVWAAIPALLYAERESPRRAVWAFVYGVYSLFALSWVCVYSWFTMRDASWLTRQLKNRRDAGSAGPTV